MKIKRKVQRILVFLMVFSIIFGNTMPYVYASELDAVNITGGVTSENEENTEDLENAGDGEEVSETGDSKEEEIVEDSESTEDDEEASKTEDSEEEKIVEDSESEEDDEEVSETGDSKEEEIVEDSESEEDSGANSETENSEKEEIVEDSKNKEHSEEETMATFSLRARATQTLEWYELEDQSVAVWDRMDIVLTSSKTYENPYLDVEIEAVFTHTDGTKIKLAGFWNGENEWRVRFAPTKEGTWTYVITANKEDDIATDDFTGLHYVTGKVLASQNTGDSEIDKHGFIEFSENGRYFQYADGTPFYWLGDTNWQAPNYVSITQCNYPGCDCGNQFKHEVDNRLEKGFNVYQTYFDSGESDGGGQRATTSEPSIWTAIVKNVQSKASTVNGSHSASSSHDNSENTYWCSTGSIADKGTQWIAYDLGAKEKFNQIEMMMHSTSSVFQMEIYGSNDASVWDNAENTTGWEKIHEATPTPDAAKWVKLSFSDVEYQYVQIRFVACSGGAWPALYETKILYNESSVEPEINKGEDLLTKGPRYRSSSVSGSHDESNVIDGDVNSDWCSTGIAPQWVAYDLGSKKSWNQIELQLKSVHENKDVAVEIYGTNDTTVWNGTGDWTKIHGETAKTDTSAKATLTFGAVEYQYIKILFTESFPGGWPSIYEIKVCSSENQDTNLITPYKTSTYNRVINGFACGKFDGSKAIDKDATTYWCSTGSAPQWIAYDLGTKKTFNHIELQLKSDKVNKDVAVEIYGTNDTTVWNGTGEWTKIHGETAKTDASARVSLSFDEAEYQYIKILFTESFPGGWPAIYEVEVYNYSLDDVQIPEEPTNLLGSAGAYDLINPETFTNKIDKMFDYLADNGMVIALGYGVHENTPRHMGDDALAAISRYLTARYASYPVVWITGQEVNGDEMASWLKSAEIVDEWDGYNHPQGTHLYANSPTTSDSIVEMNSQDWHEWWAVQAGHTSYPTKDYYKGYWETGKLFLETESFYEDIVTNINEYERSRIGAWKANLCGSYGFTYGAVGIWANSYSTAGNTGWEGSYNYEPWYMGLNKEGSYEMTYMKDFFEYVDFSTLIPRFNDSAYSDFTVENKLVSSNEDGSIYVGYFFNSNSSTGEFRGLDAGKEYTARWYNPLTGKFIDIENVEITTEGKYIIPEKPTTGDWAILVTCKDLGSYETEEAYEEKAIVEDVKEKNLALEADAICSTYSDTAWNASASNDGDPYSYWCASNGVYPQWIAYDLGSKQAFDRVKLQLASNLNSAHSFTVYGSNEDSVWNQEGNTTDWIKIKELAYDEFEGVFEFDEVEYRYVKIEYSCSGTPRNWATASEVEIYKHIDVQGEELPELPEYSGQVQTPIIDCVGGAIYTAEGVLTDTKANLTDKDYSTYWTPFSPAGTQTIIMDLQNELNLSGIIVTLGEESYLPKYRVEASNNGSDWTILADATLRSPQSTIVSEQKKMFEELSGQYRYVKLFWLGAPSNITTKTIAEIEIYASETDKSLLEEEIANAEKLDLSDYQDGSEKDAFSEALSEAKAVYNDADATQITVDAAKDALTEAMKLLKKKVDDTSTKPGDQGNTGESNKPGNQGDTGKLDKTEESGQPEVYPADSSMSSAATTGASGAKTGDTNQTTLILTMLSLAAVGLVVIHFAKKRASQK